MSSKNDNADAVEEAPDEVPAYRDVYPANPGYVFGRIDTSAGEGGESLHKLSAPVFGVAEDGTIALGAEQGTVESTPEDIVLQPTSSETSNVVGEPATEGTQDTQPGTGPLDTVVDPESLKGTVDTRLGSLALEAPEAADDAAAEADDTAVEGWGEHTVAELREELKSRGLPTSGIKDELIAALEADDAAAADDTPA